MKTTKIYLATFYNAMANDADADMTEARLFKSNDLRSVNKQAKLIFESDDQFKSYGVIDYKLGFEKLTAKCIVDGKTKSMLVEKAINWFNKQVKDGKQNIRVSVENDLILFN